MSLDDRNRPDSSHDRFPATRLSALQALKDGRSEQKTHAYDLIVAAYWKPVYKYIRIRWNQGRENAQDLTQSFFTKVLEKGFFAEYNPARARFRTFLRICLDRHIGQELESNARQKRGGDATILSLNYDAVEHELHQSSSPPVSPDAYFEQEWVRALLDSAILTLKRQCEASERTIHFRLFSMYDLEQTEITETLSYQMLADRFDLSLTDVTNYLASARREFRTVVLERIRQLTGSDEEFREEVRSLLGVTDV